MCGFCKAVESDGRGKDKGKKVQKWRVLSSLAGVKRKNGRDPVPRNQEFTRLTCERPCELRKNSDRRYEIDGIQTLQDAFNVAARDRARNSKFVKEQMKIAESIFDNLPKVHHITDMLGGKRHKFDNNLAEALLNQDLAHLLPTEYSVEKNKTPKTPKKRKRRSKSGKRGKDIEKRAKKKGKRQKATRKKKRGREKNALVNEKIKRKKQNK